MSSFQLRFPRANHCFFPPWTLVPGCFLIGPAKPFPFYHWLRKPRKKYSKWRMRHSLSPQLSLPPFSLIFLSLSLILSFLFIFIFHFVSFLSRTNSTFLPILHQKIYRPGNFLDLRIVFSDLWFWISEFPTNHAFHRGTIPRKILNQVLLNRT